MILPGSCLQKAIYKSVGVRDTFLDWHCMGKRKHICFVWLFNSFHYDFPSVSLTAQLNLYVVLGLNIANLIVNKYSTKCFPLTL